jgi:MoaA/NifB/PqqE/SkfB family radical SAM enzyme
MTKGTDGIFARDIKRDHREGDPGCMVFWQLNDLCNFRCAYCFCGEEKLSKEHPDCGKYTPEHIAKSFDDTGKTWQVHMSGGEPFLYPDFVALCDKLTDKHYISINTNLSTLNVYDFGNKIDPAKVVFINAGLHIQQRRRKKEGVDEFVKKVLFLQDKGFNIDVGYLTYVPLFSQMPSEIEYLKSKGIKLVNAKTFRGFYKGNHYPESYSEKEKEVINKYSLDPREEEIMNRKVNFFGKLCSTGVEYFRMTPSGDIFRCSSSWKKYGNLFSGGYRFDDKPTPCPLSNCDCPYEGIKYTRNGKSSFINIAKEAIIELAAVRHRGITAKKIARWVKRRV